MPIKLTSEAQREEVLQNLDISICQWTHVVEKGYDDHQKMTLRFIDSKGTMHDADPWQHGCKLCDAYRTITGDCKPCPMFGHWLDVRGRMGHPPSCPEDGSTYKAFVRATGNTPEERRVPASIMLGSMLAMREYYSTAKIESAVEYFKLKPIAELLKIPGSQPQMVGLELNEIYYDGAVGVPNINDDMIKYMDKVLQSRLGSSFSSSEFIEDGRPVRGRELAWRDDDGEMYSYTEWWYSPRQLNRCDEKGNVLGPVLDENEQLTDAEGNSISTKS